MYLRAGWGSNRGAGGGKGLILSPEGRAFKDRMRSYGFAAKAGSNWPAIENIPKRSVELFVDFYGSEADVDAPIKATLDALETVYYLKDRCVGKQGSQWHPGEKSAPYLLVTLTIDEALCEPLPLKKSEKPSLRLVKNATSIRV
jgi:hypothetical protein